MALLEIEDLAKTFYTPEHTVSAQIYLPELSLEEGEALVLDGPSGSGKTTVLHMISGLLSPDSGKIVFNGCHVSAMSEKKRAVWRAANIGYIFQRLNLLEELTVLENVLLPLCWRGDKSEKREITRLAKVLLEHVGLKEKMDSFPRQLSIGEQQRAAVVRAMVYKPKLILADEPTASLDVANGGKVLDLLQELCRDYGAALLLCTHDEGVKARFSYRYNLRSGSYE